MSTEPSTHILKASHGVGFYERAWYRSSIDEFVAADPHAVLGRVLGGSDFDVLQTQRDAWVAQTSLLQTQLGRLRGEIFLEFSIPRMGRRIDAVVIVGPVLFVIEFKVGEKVFDRISTEQVWDYALDLKNFHKASHSVPIVPVLIATEAPEEPARTLQCDPDGVYRPQLGTSSQLRGIVDRALGLISGEEIDVDAWAASSYHPTPTIVEAARALYAQHSVESIARFDAGAKNLRATSHRIEALVEHARSEGQKLICFVTGVPGAGKTLVGLNVATRKGEADETHAVFLSGNGPLVAVLREALTRDEVARKRAQGEKPKKGRVGESVKAFIQNVHHFRDDALVTTAPPVEHVVIFDEAQRAWNLQQTANFMQRKKKRPGFAQSEPEFLISCMDRHSDWSVVVCLVGGGQEINIGEAGIAAWIEAVQKSFPDWRIHISDRLVDSEYAMGSALELLASREHVHFEPDLHLAVSMRSFRAEHVSAFVKALLDCDHAKARDSLASIVARYPITLTRDLDRAKDWIRDQARGSERYGLVASSKAQRLKPHAVDIRVDVDPVHYFLNDASDTRSSYYLEDAATEFQVQGLELDWTCVTWDGDLRYSGGAWSYNDFRGSRWTHIHNPDNRNYLRNAYRVLLTRARQGMVIFVPPGDPRDPTRAATIYDPTFEYLAEVGVPVLA